MPIDSPRSTAKVLGHPIHPMLVPIPIACFVLTLVTDLAYWKTANMQWANMSAWLLAVGLFASVLAALAGVIDFFIHSRDAYTSVVPTGLLLSALVVAILLVTGWNGWEMVYRHGVGVDGETR